MKKISLLLVLMFTASIIFAQKANVSKAKNKALMEENPDFEGAISAINAALADSTTKGDVQTWHVAGLVYYKIQEAESIKKYSTKSYSEKLRGESAIKAIDYFIKADELDRLPDVKGKIKPKYQKDIKEKTKEMMSSLIDYAIDAWGSKRYADASIAFDKYLQIPQMGAFKGSGIEKDTNYVKIKYNAAIAANLSGNSDKAIAYFEDLKDDNYEELAVYQLLYEMYKAKNDTVNYVKTLKEGATKFPSEPYFIQNIINHYINTDNPNEAITYLNKAIENDPSKPQFYLHRGILYENINNIVEARKNFDKAIELRPDYADAFAGIGRIIFNQGVIISNAAVDIKDIKQYQAEVKKAELLYKESLPYFEKARSYSPKDIEILKSLKQVYYRLKMNKEFDEVTTLLKTL